MKNEKEALRKTGKAIELMSSFNPADLVNDKGPFVSIYLPIHRSEREKRQDLWDHSAFKELLQKAERTLEAQGLKKDDFAGILKFADYLVENPDMPLWIHAGEGLGFLLNNEGAKVYNLYFAPEPMVVASSTYFVKPLIRNFQYGTEYYVLELSNDRFSWAKGTRTSVEHQQLPQGVVDYFSELFANSDDTKADMKKHEEGALDFITLEGHMGQYHNHKSRNEVTQLDSRQWFHYVNRAVNDYLALNDSTPIILCCDKEYAHDFRKISTLKHLLPEGIGKDPATLDGKKLLAESLAVIDGIRDANIKAAAEAFGGDAARGKGSDDLVEIGMALAEKRIKALFMVKGKILPGSFDAATGAVTFDADTNPIDSGYNDPAAPDISDAFAQAALAQDAAIYVVEQDQMPTGASIAALYRYAE
jgi:hypothetical protein